MQKLDLLTVIIAGLFVVLGLTTRQVEGSNDTTMPAAVSSDSTMVHTSALPTYHFAKAEQ